MAVGMYVDFYFSVVCLAIPNVTLRVHGRHVRDSRPRLWAERKPLRLNLSSHVPLTKGLSLSAFGQL